MIDVLGMTSLGAAAGLTLRCWRGLTPLPSGAAASALGFLGAWLMGSGTVGAALVALSFAGLSWAVYTTR